MNALDELAIVGYWLTKQSRSLSNGLRSANDAISLYKYWQANSHSLPWRCDDDIDGIDMSKHRSNAIGYDPMQHQSFCQK